MDKVKLIINAASPVYLLGLETILKSIKSFDVLAKTLDQSNLLNLIEKHKPEVVLLDSNIFVDESIFFINKIIKTNTKILLLAKEEEADLTIQLIEGGVGACILKNADYEEIVLAIKTLANGSSYFCESVSSKLISRKSSNIRKKEIRLTDREFEILKFVADEYSNKEIADKLYISHRTVETHKRNLIHKLKVKGTVGLVKHYFSFAQK